MKPDPSSTLFKIFLAINPISLWSYYVMGIGFHKVAHISRAKGMAFSYVPWAVVTIVAALLGFGG